MLLVLTKILLLLNILYFYLYFSYLLFYWYAGQLFAQPLFAFHPPQLPDVAQLCSNNPVAIISNNNLILFIFICLFIYLFSCSVRIELTETVTTVYSFIFIEGISGTNSTTRSMLKSSKLFQHFCILTEYC